MLSEYTSSSTMSVRPSEQSTAVARLHGKFVHFDFDGGSTPSARSSSSWWSPSGLFSRVETRCTSSCSSDDPSSLLECVLAEPIEDASPRRGRRRSGCREGGQRRPSSPCLRTGSATWRSEDDLLAGQLRHEVMLGRCSPGFCRCRRVPERRMPPPRFVMVFTAMPLATSPAL